MLTIRRTLLAVVASVVTAFAATAPAAAQGMDTGPSLLGVWVWILVAGVAIFIIGTSLGVSRR
jgi:hypothetical protein